MEDRDDLDDDVPAYLVGVAGLSAADALLAEEADERQLTANEQRHLAAAVRQAMQRVRDARELREGNGQQLLLDFGARSAGNSNSGCQGLPYATRREILRLLELGNFTDRDIAAKTGVHHCTIFLLRRDIPKLREQVATMHTRCPICGGLIRGKEHQCQKCYLEKIAEREKRRRFLGRADGSRPKTDS